MENEIKTTEIQASDAAYDGMFDVQIMTAKKYPRNVQRFVDNASVAVTIDENTAAKCGYAIPRGGKQITGPSVHLARIMAQLYQNLRVQVVAGEIKPTYITAKAVAFDLESNYAIQVEATRKIVNKEGKRFNEDMINTTMLAAMSIAERNAIFKVIPAGFTDKLYEASRRKITGDLSTEEKLKARRKKAFDYFLKQYNVTERDILDLFGKQTANQMNADDVATLLNLDTSLKTGETTVKDQFPRHAAEEKKVKTDGMFDNKEKEEK